MFRSSINLKREKLRPFIETPKALTIIEAPVGYGKTSFIEEAFEYHENNNAVCLYFAFTPREDRSKYFIRSLTKMFNNAKLDFSQDILDILSDSTNLDFEDLIDKIEHCAELNSKKLFIAFDNLHLVTNEAIKQFLQDLTYAPNINLIFASRNTISFNFEQVQFSEDIARIGLDELMFSYEHVQLFFNQVWNIPFKPGLCNLLHRKLAGWPGVFNILATMHSKKDRPYQMSNVEVLDLYCGSCPELVEYLDQNFIKFEQDEFRDFLLKTSLFSNHNYQLCEALVGKKKAAQFKNQLVSCAFVETQNNDVYFSFSISEILLEYFRHKVECETSFDSNKILIDAATEFVNQEDYIFAADALIKAEQYEQGALLLSNASKQALSYGDTKTIKFWFNNIPRSIIEKNADLILLESWYLIHECKWETVKQNLMIVDEIISSNNYDESKLEEINNFKYIVKLGSYLSEFPAKKSNETIKHEREKIEKLPSFYKGSALIFMIIARLAVNDVKELKKDIDAAKKANLECHKHYEILLARILEVIYYLKIGASTEAAVETAVILHLEPKPKNFEMLKLILTGLLYYERSDMDDSYLKISEGLHLLKNCFNKWIQSLAARRYATIAALKGQPDVALYLLHEFNDETDLNAGSHMRLNTHFDELKIMIINGEIEAANKLYQSLAINSDQLNHFQRNVLNSLKIANSQYDEAIGNLNHELMPSSTLWDDCESTLLHAIALNEKGDEYNAILKFGTLADIMHEKYAILFVEHGAKAIKLIQKYATQTIATQTTEKKAKLKTLFNHTFELYNKFNPNTSIQISASSQSEEVGTDDSTQTTLVEPLSKKEQEVLEYIVQGHTNKAIAEQLSISINTVKWHVRHILEKFGVEKRTQVIAIYNQQQTQPNEE